MNLWRVSFCLLLFAVIGIGLPSIAEDGDGAEVDPSDQKQEDPDSSSQEEDSEDQGALSEKDGTENESETSPAESDSGGSAGTPTSDEATPSVSESKPRSSPKAVVAPTFLSFPMPDAIGKVMDVNRDNGVLEDLDRLDSVKSLLPDTSPPGIVSEDILNLELLLMSKHSLSGIFPNSNFVGQRELEASESTLDITSVLNHINSASVSFPLESYSSFVGRSITLGEGSYPSLDGTFIVGATSELNYSGSVSFAGSSTRVVLISGDSVSSESGSELKMESVLTDLVVASRSDWSVRDAAFSAGSRLYLRSLGDLNLESVNLTASDLVRLEALMNLSVDSATFSAGLREIQMTATTIDLSNIDFPSSSIVNLSTLKGGVDGKYPTFGSGNRAIGRVNFLENVSYGGKANLLHNSSSFDAHGKTIHISKLP